MSVQVRGETREEQVEEHVEEYIRTLSLPMDF